MDGAGGTRQNGTTSGTRGGVGSENTSRERHGYGRFHWKRGGDRKEVSLMPDLWQVGPKPGLDLADREKINSRSARSCGN